MACIGSHFWIILWCFLKSWFLIGWSIESKYAVNMLIKCSNGQTISNFVILFHWYSQDSIHRNPLYWQIQITTVNWWELFFFNVIITCYNGKFVFRLRRNKIGNQTCYLLYNQYPLIWHLVSQAHVSLSREQKPQGVKTGFVAWSVDCHTLFYTKVLLSAVTLANLWFFVKEWQNLQQNVDRLI